MERPPQRYFCNKCGYVGSSDTHPGCNYFAYPMTHLEQLYIDHLEAELEALRSSPASVLGGWKHSCNALCMDDVELWIPQCPHCGKPAPTPPVSEDRKDAERYRWLRKHGAGFVELAISVDEDGIAQRGARIEQIPEMLDVAIDAAMQEDKP